MRHLFLWLFLILTAVTACQSATTTTPTPPAPTHTAVPVPTINQPPPAATTDSADTPSPEPSPAPADTLADAGEIAYQHLIALSDGIGSRVAGSAGEKEAAQYIADAFAEMGYSATVQPFTFSAEDGRSGVPSANVMAVKEGESARELIVGAHYDTVAIGQGADDNASGVAVLLETAERIRDVETPYTIRFIAFGAEEEGLHGSTFYVNQMSAEDIAKTVAVINLDALAAGDITYIYGSPGSAGDIRDWTLDLAEAEGLALQTQAGLNPEYPVGTTCDCSDHAPFAEIGIQYAYFEATNWLLGRRDGYTQVDLSLGEQGEIWHTEHDTIAYLEETFPGRIQSHFTLFVTALYHVLTDYS
jgi:alkaline phosphatase isozyme conversion protein